MLKVRLVKYSNFYEDEFDYLVEILKLFQSCINSYAFRKSILSHPRFVTVFGLSNDEILDIIYSGREIGSSTDNEADLKCGLRSSDSYSSIGYYDKGWIYIFQNQFYDAPIELLAGFYAHEYCHSLGFSDPPNLDDLYSNVPYVVGDEIYRIAKDFYLEFVEA